MSPWQWHLSTRTFTNSFETTLTVFALNAWPWEWVLDAPTESGLGMNVLDDGPSLEYVIFGVGIYPGGLGLTVATGLRISLRGRK
jgi:hypothetical protein